MGSRIQISGGAERVKRSREAMGQYQGTSGAAPATAGRLRPCEIPGVGKGLGVGHPPSIVHVLCVSSLCRDPVQVHQHHTHQRSLARVFHYHVSLALLAELVLSFCLSQLRLPKTRVIAAASLAKSRIWDPIGVAVRHSACH